MAGALQLLGYVWMNNWALIHFLVSNIPIRHHITLLFNAYLEVIHVKTHHFSPLELKDIRLPYESS